jgi:hypothetical protein
MGALLGIDVANVAQGNVDFTLAKSYVTFALAKASEGRTFVDPSFTHNVTGAKASGVIPGAYHFLRPSAGAAQCEWFLRVTGGGAGMLLALDVEVAGAGAQVVPFLTEFVRQAPGRRILVYSSRGLWSLSGGPADITGFPVVGWHAGVTNGRYTSAVGALAAQWVTAGSQVAVSAFGHITTSPMVQFTDHATVPGSSSPCDGDAWLGTLAELKALAGQKSIPRPLPTEDDMPLLFARAADTGRVYQIIDTVVGKRAAYVPSPTILNPDLAAGATEIEYPTLDALVTEFPLSSATVVH